MVFIAIVQSILGRALLLFHSVTTVAFAATIMRNQLYLTLGAVCLFQVIEGIYMVVKRRGYEYKWISLSTICYLAAVVPPLWVVELKIMDDFQAKKTANSTQQPYEIAGISFGENVGLAIIKQTLLVVIMIHRWIIPRGSLTRSLLSQLLFVFFAMASDIMELFDLFDEERVKSNSAVSRAILAVWSLSLLQMSMVLTNTRNVVRSRPAAMDNDEVFEDTISESLPSEKCCQSALATDIWSILMTVFLMDFPFLAVRLYILIKLKVVTYGIIFFTVKNMLVVCLSIYRFIIICCTAFDEDEEKNDQQKKPAYMNQRSAKRKQSKAMELTNGTRSRVVPMDSDEGMTNA